MAASIRKALEHSPPEHLFVNPDCGLGTFSRSPVNTQEIAAAKLRNMVAGAKLVRTTLSP